VAEAAAVRCQSGSGVAFAGRRRSPVEPEQLEAGKQVDGERRQKSSIDASVWLGRAWDGAGSKSCDGNGWSMPSRSRAGCLDSPPLSVHQPPYSRFSTHPSKEKSQKRNSHGRALSRAQHCSPFALTGSGCTLRCLPPSEASPEHRGHAGPPHEHKQRPRTAVSVSRHYRIGSGSAGPGERCAIGRPSAAGYRHAGATPTDSCGFPPRRSRPSDVDWQAQWTRQNDDGPQCWTT